MVVACRKFKSEKCPITTANHPPPPPLNIRKVALAEQFGQEEKGARYHLFQQLAVLLVRGNCTLLGNRMLGTIAADINNQEWNVYCVPSDSLYFFCPLYVKVKVNQKYKALLSVCLLHIQGRHTNYITLKCTCLKT